jgi:phytoene dehydrogenase-like protein
MFCGTGTHEGPLITFRESYNVARVIIVWLKRRR